ncbi:Spc98 family-domain-containing protein [Coemansia spiralis]|nr:Spc98 family-domain-containing protein [Coemansia spiralis]
MSELDKCLYQYMDAFLGSTVSVEDERGEIERRDSLARYFCSIIDSNIAPATAKDEEAIIADMQKRLIANNGYARTALNVSRLCSLLKQKHPSYNWWPVLYFMSECCATASTPAASSTNSGTAIARSSYIAQRTGEPRPVRAAERALPPYYQSQQQQKPLGASEYQQHVHSEPLGVYSRESNQQSKYSSMEQVPEEKQGVFIYRELPTYDDVNEANLLKDLIFVMQAVDGIYIRWNQHSGAYAISPEINLSRPTRSMVISLSELGMLTADIQKYIVKIEEQGSLFEQSFCTELKAEMGKYYKLVSEIEGRLFKAPRTLNPGESPMGVTLRRLFCWMVEPRQKLRLMATAIAKVQEGKGGGDVLSIISTFVDDGDPFIQTFAKRLLKTASVPFNDILVRWVTDGELADPYEEFFIKERENHRDMFWSEKYTVASDMIPVHINGEMTRKIFQIGRSLNFLRVACDDAQWVVDGGPRTQLTSDLSDPRNLESFVYRSSSMVNARLMSILQEKFDLIGHVDAMRRYLLFEQGDFALALMEVLDNQMDRSGKSIMAHDLSAVLSSAMRSTNAQFENSEHISSILLAFDSSNSSNSNGSEHKGWGDVSLTYILSPPLSYVIPKLAIRQYFEVSQFLLKLKRVEYSLNSIWRQQMTEARSYQRSEELQRRKEGGNTRLSGGDGADSLDAAMRQAMRECAIACSEMIQFFNQVQRYISLNVIEGAWGEFLETTAATRKTDLAAETIGKGSQVAREIDIDSWNEAHSKYIEVVHEVVCGGNGLGFQRNLSGIFDTAFQFIAAARELYSERTLSVRRGTSASSESAISSPVMSSHHRGSFAERLQKLRGGSVLEPPPATDHAGRLRTIISRFKEQVRGLMRVLSHNTASDLQFLVVTIDFNGVYTGNV